MENVKSAGNDDLEKLAARAESEDKAAQPAVEGAAQAGEHLPADVEKLRYEVAGARAIKLMGVLEWALKKKDSRLSLPESAYTQAAPRLAPLMLKHNLDEYGGLPEALVPYREEIAALMFFVGIGAGVGVQLYELRAADRAAQAEAAKQGGQSQPVKAGGGAFDWVNDQ